MLYLLHIDEVLVDATPFDELAMCAHFGYLPFMEHADLVGIDDGGESVGYNDGGAIFHKTFQGILHESFALGV